MSRRKKHCRSWPEDDHRRATKKFHGKLNLNCKCIASRYNYIQLYRCIPTIAGSDNNAPILKASNATNVSTAVKSRRSTIPKFDGKPLLFLYDCETTGLNFYDSDHIIEIASTVLVPRDIAPDRISNLEFSSLCHTSHQSNPKGE